MADRFYLSNFLSRLSLEVMTLNPVCENVETAQGVPLTVTGVAQVYFNSHGRSARPPTLF